MEEQVKKNKNRSLVAEVEEVSNCMRGTNKRRVLEEEGVHNSS